MGERRCHIITKRAVDALAGVDLPEGMEFALEKTFGTDADSARELTKALYRFTDEDHIVRSDHFLGMSGALNLCGLMETNRPLEATWNNGAVSALTFVFDEDAVLTEINVADHGDPATRHFPHAPHAFADGSVPLDEYRAGSPGPADWRGPFWTNSKSVDSLMSCTSTAQNSVSPTL